MEHLKPTNKDEMDAAVKKAAEVLSAGGVILFPTDTLYGLGADATNEEAVQKIFDIKGREETKPLSAMFSDMQSAAAYVEVGDFEKLMAKKLLPGPFTFVLNKIGDLPENVTRGGNTLAMRIPDSFFCISVSKQLGKPITATSANKSGEGCLSSVKEILAQLGDSAEKIDLVIDVGKKENTVPSTVLRLQDGVAEVLREGARNHTALLNVTKGEIK